jgi:CubicO group peptidase (beta-lactamase class C family)
MHQRMWMRGLFVTALVILLGSGCGGGGQEDSAADTTTTGGIEQASEADLEAALERSFKESDAPGVVTAVQTPEYTWIGALGVADRASKEPMTPDVHHRIGSVTKTFTATLLLQAADEGLLSLDDKIDRYVKGVPNGDKITLGQMADMTSGIASYTEDDQWVDEWSSDRHRVWEPEELAQVGIKDSPLFDPGTEWHYSNTNYVLIGLALEQVTGKLIGDLYREQIIEPLGLQSTSFPGLTDSSIPEPHAQGYTLQGQPSGGKSIPISAYAVCASREMRLASSSGNTTSTTCGTVAMFSNTSRVCARKRGSFAVSCADWKMTTMVDGLNARFSSRTFRARAASVLSLEKPPT